MVEHLNTLLVNMCENAEAKFHEIFIAAENVSHEIGE